MTRYLCLTAPKGRLLFRLACVLGVAGWIACGGPWGWRDARVVAFLTSDRAGTGYLSSFVTQRGETRLVTQPFRVRPDRIRLMALQIPGRSSLPTALFVAPVDASNAVVRLWALQREDYWGPWVRIHRVTFDQVVVSNPSGAWAHDADGLLLSGVGPETQLVIPPEAFRFAGQCLRGTAAAAILFILVGCVWARRPRLSWDPIVALRILICATGLIWFVLQAYYYAARLPLGSAPDERAHISYVIHLRSQQRIVPDWPRRYEFSPTGLPLSKINHLAHPPFYYLGLSPFVPRDPSAAVLRIGTLRLINLVIATTAMGLILARIACLSLPTPFHAFTALGLANVPMLPLISGAVNNDNLALLGGALAMLGALRYERYPEALSGWLAMCAGVMLALMAKLTAGIQVGALALIAVLARQKSPSGMQAWRPTQILFGLLFVAVPAWVYAVFWIRYGSPTPFFVARTRSCLPNGSVWAVLRHFARLMSASWTGIFSHDLILKQSWLEALCLLAVPILAGVGACLPTRPHSLGGEPIADATCFRVFRWTLYATLVLVSIHVARAYLQYTRSGYLGGVQARYYFPLMPGVWMLSWRPWLHRWSHPAAILAQATLIAGFFYSGLYYTWLCGP